MLENMTNQVLDGRYELGEIVGIGGMAVVYKAYDTITKMDVSVKILKEEYHKNPEFSRRFRNESKAISLLSHKNIVKVFDVNNTPELQYIVMEYIDGITLKEYIEQQGVLTWKEAVHFTTQILRALQHAHDKGVIHRDIKPQNVMLLQNGDIRVMDFGIARFTRSETRTITDKAIGSVHYIAPEQARGDHTDERADIYSVGVLLYEMLTGQLPFEAENAVSVAVMQLQADPKLPRSVNPDIPEALEEITMQAMQKDPGSRYQSASDMLLDIDDFKKNPSIKFEYKYLTDDSSARYIQAINNSRRMEEEEYENERSPIIPVLSGIAAGFVMIAAVFAWLVLDASGLFKSKDKGVGTVLPDFTAQSYADVAGMASQYDFVFVIDWQFSSNVPENIIIEQSPKPKKTVYTGSQVTLIVSKGPKRLMVPDFTNKDFASYSQEIVELNLNYHKVEVYHDLVHDGYIVNTNPLPRTDAAAGDTVEVYVSIGPKPSVLLMPNCQNMTFEQAKIRLTAMGITSIGFDETDSDRPKGTVLSQTPAFGTPIAEGETAVRLVISNGNAPVKSANVLINMPAGVNADLLIEVKMDDALIHTGMVNPTITPQYLFTPNGAGVKQINVYLDGYLYQEIKVDFGRGVSVVLKDHGFVFAVPTVPTEAPPDVIFG